MKPVERQCIYVACEDMDFVWCSNDVAAFKAMWEDGKSIRDIAAAFQRDPDEVALLVIDQARAGTIKKRRR